MVENIIMICDNCKKELTIDMEVEYSDFLCEYYCSPDCAKDRYFDYMGSRPIDKTELKEYDMRALKNGKLVYR